MSRLFNSNSDYGVTSGGLHIPQAAGAIFIHHYPTYAHDDGVSHVLFDIRNAAGTNLLSCNKAADNKFAIGWLQGANNGLIIRNAGTYPWNVNTWNTLVFQWSTNIDDAFTLYMNDINQAGLGGVSASIWDTSAEDFHVGLYRALLLTANARLAWPTIWNTKLSLAQQTALHEGAAPPYVQSFNVVHSWPIACEVNPEPDVIGGKHLTIFGTTCAAGPDVDPYVAAGPGKGFADQKNKLLAHHDRLLSY